ncbi:MAG: hypothetical protein ACRD3P_10720 [Terriglobales bacterium]
MKINRFLRYVWRVDAVLILVAAGAITFGVGVLVYEELGDRAALRHNAQAGVPVSSDPAVNLNLGHAEPVDGTRVLRADLYLYKGGAGFSSGGYNETRNILFIDPVQEAAYWLLADNDHVIAARSDVKNLNDRMKQPIIATAVLVKPRSAQPEMVNGRLLLFSADGKKIIEVADDVRELQVATLDSEDITLLYERQRALVLTSFDSSSLTKKREHGIAVPQLK